MNALDDNLASRDPSTVLAGAWDALDLGARVADAITWEETSDELLALTAAQECSAARALLPLPGTGRPVPLEASEIQAGPGGLAPYRRPSGADVPRARRARRAGRPAERGRRARGGRRTVAGRCTGAVMATLDELFDAAGARLRTAAGTPSSDRSASARDLDLFLSALTEPLDLRDGLGTEDVPRSPVTNDLVYHLRRASDALRSAQRLLPSPGGGPAEGNLPEASAASTRCATSSRATADPTGYR